VVGHSATILKPNLTPFVVAPLAAPITVAVAPSDDSVVVETKKADETVADPDVIPVAKKEEPTEKAVPLTYVAHHPFAFAAPAPLTLAASPIGRGVAPNVLNVKASVPAGDGSPMDVLFTKEKVLAPVRAPHTLNSPSPK
jgi:hypothetical protein